MFCRTCRANLPDATTVCPRCGSDPRLTSGKVIRPIEQSHPQKQKSSSPSIIISLAIIFLIIGFVLYPYAHRPTENEVMVSEPMVLDERETIFPLSLTEVSPSNALETEGFEVNKRGTITGAVWALNEGSWPEAVRFFWSTLEDSPESAVSKTYHARNLTRMAWQRYEEGDSLEEGELFYKGIGVEEAPIFLNGLVHTRVAANDLEAAAEALEKRGEDPEAQRLLKGIYKSLGNEHYRRGSLEEAIDYFEKALAIDPRDKNLRKALKRLKREHDMEAGFRRNEGSHFIVGFEGGENAEAGYLIGLLLEEAYFKVGADLGYYPEDMIGAVLYSKEQFRDTTRSPSWVGALYDGRIKIPAGGITERTEVLEKVIFHEYTHAVVHRLSRGRAPMWLNEGMAQYEEGKRTSPYAGVLKGIVENNRVSLRALEGSFMGLSGKEAEASYLLSLSATEYIINNFGPAIYAVKSIFEGLGEGLTLEEAISSAIYISYEVFEESWLQSLRR